MQLPKFFWKVIGIVLVVSYVLPIPLGLIRLAAGLSILVCASLPFALFLQACRKRFARFNGLITWVEDRMGERWTRNLRITRPESDPRTHFDVGT